MSLLVTITVCSIALISSGIYLLKIKYGDKNYSITPKIVDCIRYRDLYAFFKSEKIEKKLRENKNLKLFALKKDVENDGKKFIYVSMGFFDSNIQRSINIKDSLNLLSEKMDDILTEKFGRTQTFFMREDSF